MTRYGHQSLCEIMGWPRDAGWPVVAMNGYYAAMNRLVCRENEPKPKGGG